MHIRRKICNGSAKIENNEFPRCYTYKFAQLSQIISLIMRAIM